jgi:GntR family transcriptional regulator
VIETRVLVDKTSSQPLFLQLAEAIREQIADGTLKTGDQAPSEFALARAGGVSRMTARRAIDWLVIEGLVYRQAGKGSFISHSKLPATTSFLSFGSMAESLGLNLRTEVLKSGIVPATGRVARDLRLEPGESVIHLERLRLIDDDPVAIHISDLPVAYRVILDLDLSSVPLTRLMEVVGNHRLASAEDFVEAAPADGEHARLLRIPVGSPILVARGTAFDEAGKPVRLGTGYFRADRFGFRIGAGEGTTFEMTRGRSAKRQ